MSRGISIFAVFVISLGIAVIVPATRLFDGIQPISVFISIMMAGVFVRLNRGMPSIDWKILSIDERKEVADRMVEIAKDYLSTLIVQASTLTLMIGVTVTGVKAIEKLSYNYSIIIVFFVCFLLGICILRMGHVLWRDYDIVRFQAKLIQQSGDREMSVSNVSTAEAKIAAMKTAEITKVPHEIRNWN